MQTALVSTVTEELGLPVTGRQQRVTYKKTKVYLFPGLPGYWPSQEENSPKLSKGEMWISAIAHSYNPSCLGLWMRVEVGELLGPRSLR